MNETKVPVGPQTDESEREIPLQQCRTIGKLPATDIERARRFYAEKLGLTRYREMAPGHYIYECGDSIFLLYPSRGTPSGTHDQLVFVVPDVDAVVRQLKARGVSSSRHVTILAPSGPERSLRTNAGERHGSKTARVTCSTWLNTPRLRRTWQNAPPTSAGLRLWTPDR